MKSYSFKELALAYFPDKSSESATKQLRSWITNIPDLSDALVAAGHYKNQKILPPRLISILVNWLGEPETWVEEDQLAEKENYFHSKQSISGRF